VNTGGGARASARQQRNTPSLPTPSPPCSTRIVSDGAAMTSVQRRDGGRQQAPDLFSVDFHGEPPARLVAEQLLTSGAAKLLQLSS